MNIPRSEHPRPQFERPTWMNLNGEWEFEIDHAGTGRARGLLDKKPLEQTILVPFCPESKLSGIQYTDFMNAVWYRRTFTLPEEAEAGRVLLHFGAVDYRTEVWVNGKSAGTHEGGYASFTFDITEALVPGENELTVCADDLLRSARQPSGKQSMSYESGGCMYTRTTGIWQTVWLEWVPDTYIESFRMTPDAANGRLYIDAKIQGLRADTAAAYSLKAEAFYHGEAAGRAEAKLDQDHARLTLEVADPKLWGPLKPEIYDLKLSLQCGSETVDDVKSYFALRSVAISEKAVLINGKPVFQRLILDQGFYPDGIYTAPTDAELKADIERSIAMGFNGARLHQKVFEQRYLYHADMLGYLCWGEMPSWGPDPARAHTLGIFEKEWLEVVNRDFNSPAIVGWCPFNEVWGESGEGLRDLTLSTIYRATKAVDPTRPVIDCSGGYHSETDIYDVHDYEQHGDIFFERFGAGQPLYDRLSDDRNPNLQHYDGKKPLFVSEYGGIRWTEAEGWGYGEAPRTEEEFIERYRALTTVLLRNPEHMGFCYTQLTDVEQEQNGLYTYERVPKFPPKVICKITSRKAAIEEEELPYETRLVRAKQAVADHKNVYYQNGEYRGADFWDFAEIFEVIEDAYEVSGDKAYFTQFSEMYDQAVKAWGENWKENPYNDDIMWLVIAMTRAYLYTKDKKYLRLAEKNYNKTFERAYSKDLGGGLFWRIENQCKNACVNGPGAVAAGLLGLATGKEKYWEESLELVSWESRTLFEKSTGKIYDNIGIDGNVNKWSSTYNQGTFIGACLLNYRHTGDKKWRRYALAAADYAMNDMYEGGIMNNEEQGGDMPGFKGILARYIRKLVEETGKKEYLVWLRKNADSAWEKRNASGIMSTQLLEKLPNINTYDVFSASAAVSVIVNAVGEEHK